VSTLEVIHLRMSGDNSEGLVDLVRRAVGNPHGSPNIRIYLHARVENDLLIQLHRDEPTRSDQPSELGLRLAAVLRIHGLVEHSVWIGVEN